MSAPVCPYCMKLAELTSGRVIYPGLRSLWEKKLWYCRPCEAWVGCHDGTDVPLGRLANKELRVAKQKAHAAFDALWKGPTKQMSRPVAYKLMQRLMDMSPNEAHIGQFSVEQCEQLCRKLSEYLTPTLF